MCTCNYNKYEREFMGYVLTELIRVCGLSKKRLAGREFYWVIVLGRRAVCEVVLVDMGINGYLE